MENENLQFIIKLAEIVIGFGGLGGLVTLLVNAGKSLGWVKDGKAKIWVGGANLLLMLFFMLAPELGLDVNWVIVDETANSLLQIATIVIGYIGMLKGSDVAYGIVKGIPVIGKSYSLEDAEHWKEA